MVYDVLILGGGAAGYTAALYAARAGLSALVLEKAAPGGQITWAERVENYPVSPTGPKVRPWARASGNVPNALERKPC